MEALTQKQWEEKLSNQGWVLDISELPEIQTTGFITRPPLTRRIPHTNLYVLYEAVTYDVGWQGSGQTINVPVGFVTDFASIPKALHSLYSPRGSDYEQAAIVHDWLYVRQQVDWNLQITRKYADNIFLEAMEVLEVPKIRRHIFHRAVRVGGFKPWNKRAKKINEIR